ncbi:SNF2 family N-terminal domain-containing protein [Geodermatophilus ruber]|uniref:SNF2 family N-terminal domain-containing protein n=2 Tax=Geodermatophilus ruber TaxID=504800 RepID=A0A1I4CXK0_9ACTN|nr:SNF2 family N-terminal domain-containing protein [Geodermatophilus ruber]
MRERLWRVDYLDGDIFGATALDGRDNQAHRFHRGLERLDEGALPLPAPEAVGDQRQQDLLLDAQRFSLLHGTAPILGLQRSRAIPTDYQIVPLLMALGSEQVRLLIADDVGTGKTIEAGLVASELMARGRARRVLIVVPANLREQWRDALDHFFHIDATIVSGNLLPALERKLLPGKSVWSAHDVVIASIDYLKTRTQQVLAYPWDLVVIDEAHLCAMPHTLHRDQQPDMERWQFAQAAAAAARHLLLLTATPHNGYTDSYASLFRMLDATLVHDTPDGPVIDRDRARAHHVVQRQRRDIEAWYEQRGVTSPFPKRRADEQIIELAKYPDMRLLLEGLHRYAEDLYGAGTAPVDRWIAAHLQKRALSSPYALRKSVENRVKTLRKQAAVTTTKQVAVAREATSDQLFTENDEGDAANLDRAASTLQTAHELARLEEIAAAAKKVTPPKDPKLQELFRLLPERMAAHPDTARVLVFTKFKDTLDYLADRLEHAASGRNKKTPALHGAAVFAIHGQMSLAQRSETFAAFERAPKAVLVATDCISEGLNLQRACAELVHYELPWNPNRLEQRNGRIDRFQQKEPFVGIRTLVYDDPLDAALLYLIDTKAQQMRADYGFVPPFLANSDILLHLSDPGSAYRASLQEKRRHGQMAIPGLFAEEADADLTELDSELARLAEANISGTDRLDKMRVESFYGQSDIDLATIETALSRSRDEIGSAQRIAAFTRACIRELQGDVAEHTDGTFTIHPIPGEIADTVTARERYTFDPVAGIDDAEVDMIDLAHPLMRRLIDLTLDKAQLPECTGRITGRISPNIDAAHLVLHVLFRYVARGNPPVLLEEIVPLAYRLSDGSPVPDPWPLLTGPGGAGQQYRDDLIEDARDVLRDPDLRPRLDRLAAARARTVAEHHAGLSAEWANGLDDVEATSADLIAVTLVYPEVAP